MQPTLPLDTFAEHCKFCAHQLNGRSKHFCTTCLPPLSQWANIKDYGKHYNILRSAIGIGREGQNKCRIPSTHPAYIHPPRSPGRVVQKNCRQCGKQFEGKQVGTAFCSKVCRNITSSNKTEQSRLTRIQIQADKLFPRSDIDLTGFAALVTDFLSKQTDTANKSPRSQDMPTQQEDAPIRCNMCQEPFTRTDKGFGYSYCIVCIPKLRRWYNYRDIKPELAERQCARCATIFRPDVGKPSKYCLTSCTYSRAKAMQLTCRLTGCSDCTAPTKPRGRATRCERCQFIAMATRKDANSARRRYIESAGDNGISWRTVGERDSWICHLCSRKVLQQPGKAKNPKGATVDHLIPLADGGLHIWQNVGLAHRDCNMSRGSGGIAQLKLID